NKSTTEIEEPAPRGDITDINGLKLATSQQSFTLTFTETSESDLYFYQTMDKIFQILDKNKDSQKDDFELKVNPFAFNFKTDDDDVRKQVELRFKKDRGLDDQVKKKLFPKKTDALTDDDNSKIDEALLKITPEETFNYLVKLYGITPEGIFKNYVELYKSSPDDALDIIKSNYKISSESEVKALLEQYKTDKKNAKATFTQLVQKCGVDTITLSQDQQRRYMLVKDALKMQSFSGPSPITLASNVCKDTAFAISQELSDLPGVDVTIEPVRTYPYGELGSSFLGYLSKINSNQESYEEKGYDVNSDYIGVSGIEQALEDRLKGSKGAKIVQINPVGRVTQELGTRDSYPGDTVQLTIDSNVQYAAQVALNNVMKDLQSKGRQNDVNTTNATRGAAVAVDVNTGGILALVSNPGFDPNDFVNPAGLGIDQFKKYFQPDMEAFGKSKGYDQAKIDQLFPVIDKNTGARSDPYDILPRPLYNYATFSLTAPGSTFKPMTAIAGLETGVITPGFTVNDRGFFDDGHNFHTTFPSDGSNGVVDLVKALAKSSNPYFMTVGQKIRDTYGDDKLAEYAWKFGLGVNPQSNTKPSTGIEIAENFGQVYNSYTNKNRFASTYLYITMDTLLSGRGYRGNTFTPIELHINGSESDDVKALRQKIRDQIQQSIKTGDRADSTYKTLVTQLVNTDPLYKGKNISQKEIADIAYEIEYITVDDANFQTKIGTNMYDAAIGQGIDAFTPLQLANYIATIVNGGNRYSLHLVDKLVDPEGNIVQQNQPQVLEKTGIKQSTIDAVKAGMQAVTGDDGTAKGVFNSFPIPTAGKTGSATFRNDQDQFGRTSSAVYVGFAPVDKPQIAIAVIIFDGGHGSFAAPVARAMYEAYFKKELDAMNYVPQNDIVAKPLHGN
ncbi:MAG: penicillin-binding transpeptidase domain-containing protein, partial [Bacillota bacterium]|nr:penicillin-binding transpeptidase domain-containing protein [Bacillota bacterium]